jgi:hypothetical protein
MMGRVIVAAALFTILTGSPAMFGEQLDAAESDGALEQAQPAASPAATASQDQSAASSRTNQPASGSKRLLDVGQDYVADLFRVRRGVAPKIGTAGPGSGLAFGAELVERRFFETSLFVAGSALYSYRGHALYNLRIGSSRESPRFDLPPADARASSLFDYTRRSQPG